MTSVSWPTILQCSSFACISRKQSVSAVQKAYRNVFAFLPNIHYVQWRSLRMQAIWPALAAHAWSPQVGALIAALHTKLRWHSLQLLSRSYSTISPAKAAMLLGASVAELQPCEPPCTLFAQSPACCEVVQQRSQHSFQKFLWLTLLAFVPCLDSLCIYQRAATVSRTGMKSDLPFGR